MLKFHQEEETTRNWIELDPVSLEQKEWMNKTPVSMTTIHIAIHHSNAFSSLMLQHAYIFQKCQILEHTLKRARSLSHTHSHSNSYPFVNLGHLIWKEFEIYRIYVRWKGKNLSTCSHRYGPQWKAIFLKQIRTAW